MKFYLFQIISFLKIKSQFFLQNYLLNFDSNVDLLQQYRRALCVIFNSKLNPASVREGTIKLFVTVYLILTMLKVVVSDIAYTNFLFFS